MALYYFDMIDGHDVRDPEGREIDGDLASVREEALKDARELIAGAAHDGVDITGRRFEIKDGDHHLVLIVQFRDAVERENSVTDGHAGPPP